MVQLRSLATVSGFTAISRVLGFLRDMMIARFIGANITTDAFFTAFRFPNMFRRIFGEGAFNAAFVPLFAKKLDGEGKANALHFGSHTFSMLAIMLAIVTVIAIPCMGFIMSLVAPGFKARFDSGWIAPGEQPVMVDMSNINVKGARDVYVVLESKNGQVAPGVRFDAGTVTERETHFFKDLLGKGRGEVLGEPSDLWDYRPDTRKDEMAFLLDSAEAIGFRMPKQHKFTDLALTPQILWQDHHQTSVRLTVYRNHPMAFPLTVTLARVTFIYLLCMALAAHLSGVLNTVRVFGMPAAAPIMLNVIFLIGLVAFVLWRGVPNGQTDIRGGYVLAWCVCVAGFVQLGALWWTCHRKGYPIKLVRPKVSPEMKRLFLLMGPGILSAGIQQINLLVGGIIASYQENAISYLYYSERVYQLPLGMVGIAFGVVLLPDISRQLRAKKDREAQYSLNRGIEYALLVTVPATVALLVIAFPIISGIFEWGKHFTSFESAATAPALSAFAIGLPGYVLVKVLQPGYFAREDMKTPMKIAAITVLTNIVVSLILFMLLRSRGYGHIGIALATSIAAWVNVFLLAIGLRKRGFLSFDTRLMDRLWRITLASVLMGGLLLVLFQALDDFLMSGRWQCLVSLTILIAVGLASFVTAALTLRATSLAELKQGFKRS